MAQRIQGDDEYGMRQSFVVSFNSLGILEGRGMTESREKIIEKELSYLVGGCVFDVHNEIGPGVREECYQKAMECRLVEDDLALVAKPRTRTEFVSRNVVVDVFEPDLLIPGRMILEFKHQAEGLARENFTQVLSYLKFWDLRLGLLINFAMDKAIIQRIPYEPRQAEVVENYDYIRDVIREEHRRTLRGIRDSLLALNERVGVGYADTTYRNLAIVEFRSQGLKCQARIEVNPVFRDRKLPQSPITPLVVDERVCVQIEAIHDEITARAVRTMQTHLRLTDCDTGIIACFGKTVFQIRGIRR